MIGSEIQRGLETMSILTSMVIVATAMFPPVLSHLHQGSAKSIPAPEAMGPVTPVVIGDIDPGLQFRQPPMPEVVLTFTGECETSGNTGFRLSSPDRPPHWTPVPHGSIQLELLLPEGLIFDFLEVRLDGEPLKPRPFGEGLYQLPCPAPGKHLVQARYLTENRWSAYSLPLRFEIRLPRQPQIVAISDAGLETRPVDRTGVASIRSGTVNIRLANIDTGTRVVAYLDGQAIPTEPGNASCCRTVRLEGHITPGVHALTVRTVHCAHTACSLTSKPSDEVMLHYYDEDVYLLRPGKFCESRAECSVPQDDSYGGPWMELPGDTPAAAPPLQSGPESLPGSSGSLPSPSPSAPPAVPAPPVRFDAEGSDESNPALPPKPDSPEEGAQRDNATTATGELRTSQSNPAVRLVNWNMDAPPPQPAASPASNVASNGNRTSSSAASQLYESPIFPIDFYFASAAHFPLQGYGLQGEVLDRAGLVIYEDMKFTVGPNGQYRLEFDSNYPEMPVTLRLQLQIQPRSHGPWYTVTLPPIRISPEGQQDRSRHRSQVKSRGPSIEQECCAGVHRCVCTGRSEILARCSNGLGDQAKLRRTGTARFGFGFESTRQTAGF